jgi:hypothetical protein
MRLCYRQVIYTFIWEVNGKFGAHHVMTLHVVEKLLMKPPHSWPHCVWIGSGPPNLR